jgi:hypothetical protein
LSNWGPDILRTLNLVKSQPSRDKLLKLGKQSEKSKQLLTRENKQCLRCKVVSLEKPNDVVKVAFLSFMVLKVWQLRSACETGGRLQPKSRTR